jgi:hypothetical protein
VPKAKAGRKKKAVKSSIKTPLQYDVSQLYKFEIVDGKFVRVKVLNDGSTQIMEDSKW